MSFTGYLKSKNLSEETIQYYNRYYKKIKKILKEIDREVVDQEVINSFLSIYPHIVCRAFLKNYLKYLQLNAKTDEERGRLANLEIPKTTGRKGLKKPVVIPEEHIRRLRDYFYMKEVRLGLMFDLSYYGGLRREELVNIRLVDFNLTELEADINAPVKLLVVKGKGNKQRYVILPKILLKAILLYTKEKNIPRDKRLFGMGKRNWWWMFYKACKNLGYVKKEGKKELPLYHPHSIRHTISTEWWEKGVDIVSIQKRLGHSNISTTREYISPDEKKEEIKWSKEYQ